MSRAFVKEDALDAAPEVDALPARAEAQPITPRGLAELVQERERLVAAGEGASRRARQLAAVLGSVVVREPALQDGGAGFGCVVTVERDDGGRRTYEIVGPDEAAPERGRISIAAPLARALLGQREDAVILVDTPRGEDELRVVAVRVAR